MAQINQEIKPTQDPSYLRNSRAVDAPSDIKPTGTAPLSILPEGVKIADRSAEYQGQADAAGMKADAIGDSSFASLFSDVVGIGNFLGKMLQKNKIKFYHQSIAGKYFWRRQKNSNFYSYSQ